MTVIAFLNKKGGSGKSTAVIGLGLYWAIREGKKVGVLDMEVEGLAASVIDLFTFSVPRHPAHRRRRPALLKMA